LPVSTLAQPTVLGYSEAMNAAGGHSILRPLGSALALALLLRPAR
jgi:hypothetical protein